ncbi:polysaccharide deacetylase family protein [Naumannella cuiyingiana]|uniref:Peptidoglycan/xylan/chitin deacetylase (PgdA/CDA1 family) n=1 Tax=Naumannella cuiyingiana TaxID=1347891 RepID=A0A7Z0DBK8_9ACTN|nr:polysaccharide deacetylase family protein [Naumannella cuiyingiana]NYI72331.1 peptidoglycan/xylan/chitin deacetylase (PgdA/CDA1 family) [Naumannella cuiyingiana]
MAAPLAALVLGLVLSGCTGPSQGIVPGTPPQPGGQGGDEAAPVALAEVDRGLVGGLDEGKLSSKDAGVSDVAVPFDPDSRNLSLAVELATNKGLRNNAMANGTDYTQQWRVVGSSPKAVGIWLDTSSTVEGKPRKVPISVWYDRASDRGVAAPGLISLDGWPAFVSAVTDALPRDADAGAVGEALGQEAAPYGNGPAMGFDAEGNAVLAFRDDLVPGPVRVPRAAIDPLLSPFGIDAQASATAPERFDPGAKLDSRDRKESVGGEDEKAGAEPSEEPQVVDIPQGPGGSGGEASDEPTAEPAARPYPWVGVNCKARECAAMTYDDGPASGTPDVIEAYLAQGQALTFFQLGQVVANDEEMSTFAAAKGMEIASHTYVHDTSLPNRSPEKNKKEFGKTNEMLAKTTGRPPLFMRPPGGAVGKLTRQTAKESGQAIVNWDIDTRDWATKDTVQTAASAQTVKPGGVVLMHDIHAPTVAAAEEIATTMTEKGYSLVTIGELSDYSWDAGKLYCGERDEDACDF